MTDSSSQLAASSRVATQSRFLYQVGATLTVRLAMIVLGLIGSVLIARTLGPSGRGEYAVAVAVSAIAVQAANLGLHTSSSWAASRRPELVGRLLANGIVASVTIGGVVAAGLWLIVRAFPAALPLPPELFGLALVSIPPGLLYLVVLNILLGLQRVAPYNALELLNRGLSVALIGALAALGVISAFGAYAAVVVTTVVATIAAVILLVGRTVNLRPDRRVLLEYGGYGLRAYVAALFTYLVLRVDLLMVQYILGSADAGQYSIAVGFADMLYLVPIVVATLLFPRLSAQSDVDTRWREARRAAVAVLGFTSVLGAVAALVSGPIVILLFGEEFAAAVPAFNWLVPGVILLSVQTVVMHYFYAIGAPAVTIYAPLTGAAVNAALNLLLVPRMGVVGASLASTGAYGVMLVISWASFRRMRHTPPPKSPAPSGAGGL